MNHRLKPYPAYKDSGVLWLGEVPEHWDIKPIGRLGFLLKGRGRSKADEIPQGKPCIRYGDLYTQHEYHINQTRAFISKESACYYTPIEYGDILFAASGETIEDIGRSAVNLINSETFCGGDVLLFRPKIEFIPRYLGYASDSPASRHQKACMGKGFTVIHIYGSQLRGLTVPIPPLPEQSTIVRYLDYVDRRIQRYIRAKQKLIMLLEEQKQAIIHQAVTGRIDVRTGKPYPAYKPSGVEWLGDVPEHWEMTRLKRVSRVQTGITLGKNYGNLPLVERPYLRVANVQAGRMDLMLIKTIRVPIEEANRSTLEPGDVLMTEGGDIDKLGRGCIWRGEILGCLHQNHVFAVRPFHKQLMPEFLVALIGSLLGRRYFQLTAKQTTNLAATNSTTLGDFPFPLPSVHEQRKAIEWISEQSNQLDIANEKASNEIVLLGEYRTRLISDVVTGKLDVREAAANLPEELEEELPEDQGQEDEADAGLDDEEQDEEEE
ncbi:MAG TPA: restriction endonuclease subunit S [Candidatus Fermentibacter daniensis]|nr:restriction endonuclease subunit S [Candidatus Fermentibacter daniensis]HOR07833.1 restriction endonuclease subunit S [Candidatus Fermentibacter daniensis]HOZ18703.1 restriction endonuclease subunit S [Candidatus Fermentibacter daniensis]HPH40635.1 restriction endonuclease subunit S [Candidatus Fermentibacter daniensis]HPK52736.1 restriction endonuclease subunit S [Candidatus Fermentibacter daniensis]